MSASSRATASPSASRRGDKGQAAAALFRGLSGRGREPLSRRRVPRAEDLAARLRSSQQALRTRIERRDALLDIVRAVNSSLDPAAIAALVLERARTWIPAPSLALVSSDRSGQLSMLADAALDPDMEPAVYRVAEWVTRRGQEFASADLSHEARAARPVAPPPASVIAFPLTCRSRHVAALIALDRVPSTAEPRVSPLVSRAIRTLLEPAAAALDNALLLKRAEELSVTDDLTQLYNSRFLNLALRRETKRAGRSGRPLSLLFIDLDGFKSVNDAHGHLCGSRALIEAGRVIRSSARETDIVARFGGDEFALVLPDTGGAGALAVGERIRERIAGHDFLAVEGLSVRLTASVGVATLPDAAASADELVHAADAAMYQVKKRGKNGIQSADPAADN